jgi:protein-disulfide isomerase
VKHVERLLNLALVFAAMAMAVSVVHRELANAKRPSIPVPPPVFHKDWKAFAQSGRRVAGSEQSPVQIVEFLDLECPACRAYQAKILAKIKQVFSGSVGITIVHYPLRIHRFAEIAARASECAAQQGRFGEFVDLAFAKQDSFGIKPWPEFAGEAKVADIRAYSSCLASPSFAMIDSGTALARQLGISGTPTMIVNGWQFGGPPSEDELSQDIRAILAGTPRKVESYPGAKASREP